MKSAMRNSKPVPPFSIRVKLGSKQANVILDPSHESFSSFHLHYTLNFTPEQRLFVKIIALEDEESKVRINFHNDKDIPMGTILTKEQMIHDLRPNKNYLVIIQDTRTVTENDLTPDELKDIKRVFDEMDKDKSGSISLQEVKQFYKQEMELNMRIARKVCDQKIQKQILRKEIFEKEYVRACQFFETIMNSNISHFMQQDTDNNQVVTWEEFLKHQAKVKVSNRKIG
ncbi:hypothetical protein C9374_005596 [Naegleria lovaniensis]|uniref:EF-hand domain-containing protein n=1 Tax=Naegleria lovaniensis TaxID=51637 RepID=A0AA88GK12_NAELO|nr:uncharacterized protein C9374_005596 [Naegleria lovaniensis]KAG2382394.1 hypothetical protein C9374_005596 [Naegleria lovaniensis]